MTYGGEGARRRWKTWALPLICACAVGAIAIAVVVGIDVHHTALRSTQAAQSLSTFTPDPPAPAPVSVPCGDRLKIEPGQPGGAAGTESMRILFVNVGDAACIVQGYPSIVGLQPTVTAREEPTAFVGGLTSGSTPPRLVVGPGQIVSTLLVWGGDPSNCPGLDPKVYVTKQVQIAVPGGTPHIFNEGVGPCRLVVTPIVGGTTGRAAPSAPAVTVGICRDLNLMPLLEGDGRTVNPTAGKVELLISNTGQQDWVIQGFLQVTAYDGSGRRLGTAAVRGPDSNPFTLRAAAGDSSAAVWLYWNPVCTAQIASVVVSEPGGGTSGHISLVAPDCDLQVAAPQPSDE